MDKLIKYTILAVVAGTILTFNIYHADYKLLVAQVGTIVLVALWLIYNVNLGNRVGYPTGNLRGYPGVMLFLGVCVLSFALSPHKLTSWQELYKVGAWIVFGAIVGAAEKKELISRKEILNTWLICAAVAAVYGIFQFLGIDFMRFKLPGGRIVSTFGNATLLAGFLAMTVPIALARAFETKKAFGLVTLLLICLVLTKSRGGILAAITGIGITLLLIHLRGVSTGTPRRWKVTHIWKWVFVVLAVALILFIIPQSRYIIFEVILRKTARVYLWKDALQMVRVNPLFGTGIGTFGLYFPQFVTEGVLKMHPIEWEFVNHAHCEYLEILIETGMVGLMAFLAVAAYAVKKARNCPSLLGAFAAILVHNIVSVDLRYTSTGLFFWMIAGIFIWRERS